MSPRVSRGLGPCDPSPLIFNAKTHCPLYRISFSSREISVVVNILHVFCKFMWLHST